MKGNAIVGQSGGPTSVINASLYGVLKRAGSSKAVGTVYGMRFAIEGFMNGEILNLSNADPSVVESLPDTPSSALGSCRYKLKDADLPGIFERLKKLDIRYIFLIGGNDTMDTIHRIEAYARSRNYEIQGIGIPKTVDNDLFGTDHTPGFPSAARYVALSVQQAGILANDMQRVDRFVVYQTVGREAGWLAAASAVAKKDDEDAPHLIYVPERKLNRDRVLSDVTDCIKKYGWVSIVCGEGILWDDGTPVSATNVRDNFSNVEFGAMGGGSAALSLHALIRHETGFRGEFQIPESLAMCAADRASRIDREEAVACGQKAVELAEAGVTGVMVSMVRKSSVPYAMEFSTVPLGDVAVHAKPMDGRFINASGNFVTDAFLEYVRPLVGEIPEYRKLRKSGILS